MGMGVQPCCCGPPVVVECYQPCINPDGTPRSISVTVPAGYFTGPLAALNGVTFVLDSYDFDPASGLSLRDFIVTEGCIYWYCGENPCAGTDCGEVQGDCGPDLLIYAWWEQEDGLLLVGFLFGVDDCPNVPEIVGPYDHADAGMSFVAELNCYDVDPKESCDPGTVDCCTEGFKTQFPDRTLLFGGSFGLPQIGSGGGFIGDCYDYPQGTATSLNMDVAITDCF